MRRRAWLLLLALLCGAVPAGAHQSDPTIATVVDEVRPELPGVTIEVRAGVADQLLVVNTTTQPLTILATGGEPFLRIGQTQVEANDRSPDWYTSNSPLGLARVPATASPTATPHWRVVAKSGAWGWFDHRLHPVTRPLTDDLRKAGHVVRLADWTVPFRYGAASGRVLGHVEYRPLLGAFHSVVDRVPGAVAADVLDGRVPGLFVTWHGSGTLTVRGIDGEAFARFTPTGVDVNQASATYQDDQRLRGNAVPDVAADANAPPRWHRATTTRSLTWLDRRLAYAPGFPPPDVAVATTPTTLVEWSVPTSAGDLVGVTAWQPTARPARHVSSVPILVAVAVAALGALVLLRRRAAR